ncbi:hypothetical protein ACVDG9_28135 [Roseibium sp. RP-7]
MRHAITPEGFFAFSAGLLIRVTGDIIALSPPLIVEEGMIDKMVETLGQVLSETA